MNAIEALKSRRSIRIYQKRLIEREVLAGLVDCARLAPSAINQQTWEFVILTEPARIAALAELIPQAPWLIDAPACIAVLVKPVNYYVEDGASATVVLQIAATAQGTHDWARINIHDTGPGIPPHVRPHIFDPFFSGREAGRGLGFGLSKCWRVVTLHGGRVDVASVERQGTTFIIELPMASPQS